LKRRRKSRILALGMLYGMDLQRDPSIGGARLVLDLFTPRMEQCVEDYSLHLVHGVLSHKAAFDDLLAKQAFNWKLNRIAVIDRLAMYIALFEMFYEESVPDVVCINEAIDIVKMFSTAESGQFVNGILDNIRKERARANAGGDEQEKKPRRRAATRPESEGG
jgi:N utilization substance protein B